MKRLKWSTIVVALLVIEALATLLDLGFGPGQHLAAEERFNAVTGLQLACGHWESTWQLQYRPFCGGCVADAIGSIVPFRTLGPTVLAWKLVPASLHLLLVGCGSILAWRAAPREQDRPLAAIIFVALLLGAPMAQRELQLTGWGNHAESTALVFAAATLVVVGRGQRRVLWAAGVLAGFATWYAPIAGAGTVAIILAAGLQHRRQRGWVLAGIPLGLLPLLLQRYAHPEGWPQVQDAWLGLQLPPAADLWRWAVVDWFAGAGALGTGWHLVVGVIGCFGALWGLITAYRSPASPGRVALAFPGLALLALGSAMVLRYDLWQDTPALIEPDAFHLRHRAPLVPMAALGTAMAVSWAPSNHLRKSLGLLIAVVALGGMGLRIAGWWNNPGRPIHTTLVPTNGVIDLTVPSGQPIQRRPQDLGRTQDVAAARDFLDGHQDVLPLCRQLHEAEWNRRRALSEKDPSPPRTP